MFTRKQYTFCTISLLEFASKRLCIETTELQLGPFKVPCERRENIERFSCERVSRSKIRAVPCERSVRFEGDKVDCENSRVSTGFSLLGFAIKRLRIVLKIY